jgi:hypothetical protein
MAAKWQKENLIDILDILYRYCAQTLRKNPSPEIFTFLDNITTLRRLTLEHPTINPQLQLEALLCKLKI